MQIENELYDSIRPKRKGISESRPIELLSAQGIEYVEVRGIDLSPDSLVGISKDEMRLLDVFLIHCLISESKPMNQSEYDEINKNYELAIHSGSNLDLDLSFNCKTSTIRNKISKISEELLLISKELNSVDPEFENSVSSCLNKKNKSMALLNNIFDLNQSFKNHVLEDSMKKMNELRDKKPKNIDILEAEKSKSIELLQEIESKKGIELDQYVEQYNDKVRG